MLIDIIGPGDKSGSFKQKDCGDFFVFNLLLLFLMLIVLVDVSCCRC